MSKEIGLYSKNFQYDIQKGGESMKDVKIDISIVRKYRKRCIKYQRENESLNKEYLLLKEENESLKDENESLKEENESLKEE
jgi:predicted RNase H-like nuclease (RuvC/YqgF family)|tara:strand:- start:32 stop:277 length:246 start_codon:yes stop_codon:yes gene_type:complete